LTENFKILATDDQRIKSFGEIFTNDSSREILQLLFNEELSATQIAQKSNISLQLVKYHLGKLQSLDVVKISKIEKNSKSQDMKIYTASKFSIVIVPPTLSEKTRESKSLVRSFRHIYKVAGFGIATGFSGLLSLSQMQNDTQITIDSKSSGTSMIVEESADLSTSKTFSDESVSSMPASSSVAESESPTNYLDSEYLKQNPLEIADTALTSSDIANSAIDLFAPLAIVTAILGVLTVYYLYQFFKKI
jgi:hypothetical protein